MPRGLNKPSWESIRGLRRWSETEGSWVVAELRRSGLSAKQFAGLHGVSVTRVYQWCSRLESKRKKRAPVAGATPRLVEVKLPTERGRTFGADRIEIELLSGRRLSVPDGVSLERVSALLALLERQ